MFAADDRWSSPRGDSHSTSLSADQLESEKGRGRQETEDGGGLLQSIVRVTASEPTLEWTNITLHAAQELDEDFEPVIRWLSLAHEDPTKNEVAAYGIATRSYVQQ